jgi:hypothetical protein
MRKVMTIAATKHIALSKSVHREIVMVCLRETGKAVDTRRAHATARPARRIAGRQPRRPNIDTGSSRVSPNSGL